MSDNERAPRPIKPDAVEQELLKYQLTAVADEMAIGLMKSAFSGVIRDILDFSTAICDSKGRMIAQGLSLPIHLGSIPAAMASILGIFGDDCEPGDIFALNDPYSGGMHLPDIFLIHPVFVGGVRVGFTAVVAHHSDIGGRVPGGSAADSTELFQEGLRIVPVKIQERWRLDEKLVRLILSNVRVPNVVNGDLGAQLSMCQEGGRRLSELVERMGLEKFEEYTDALLAYSEGMVRQEISQWPDGEYSFEDFEDHDGITDVRVPIRVSAVIDGDEIYFDFAGSSPQVAGAINATPSFVESAVHSAVRSLMTDPPPNNEGFSRPISISLPPGSVLNPDFPRAVAARGVIGYRVIDTVFGALSGAIPDRVGAAGEGGTSGVRFGGYLDGEAFQVNDILCGSWGGRPDADGLEGVANFAANVAIRPIEILEAEDPIRVECFEFVPDSGGAGQFRGGLALRRVLRYLGDEPATLQVRTHRRLEGPYGLFGGLPGRTSSASYESPDGTVASLATKVTRQIEPGAAVEVVTAGGGGWGEPMDRSRGAIAADIREGRVTLEAAFSAYGYTEVDIGLGAPD